MLKEYIPQSQNGHGREEELQWARIIGSGEVVNGMVIIFLQKMCAAFHEFDPAYRAGALNEIALPYFRDRLSKRVQSVLNTLQNNGLDQIVGYDQLVQLKRLAETAGSLKDLADLGEPIHRANHIVTDGLEKWSGSK
jgi:hypothetical protein